MLNLLEYLEGSATRLPNKTAFSDEKREFTFRQLLDFAQSVGTAIARRLPAVNQPVVVLTDRTAVTVAAFQAVLAAGCCYVPIDVKMPMERMEAILRQLRAPLLLYAPGQEKVAEAVSGYCEVLDLAEAETTPAKPVLLSERRERVLDMDPAYAMFTSGSTGIPKGIVCHHRGVIDLAEWLAEAGRYSEEDVLANQAPFYFDGSVKDVYMTLKCGATCYILPKKLFMFPKLLVDYLDERQVTTLAWATSAFRLVAASGVLEQRCPSRLKKVLVGGEALLARDLNRWRQALPNVRYINLYGPTEATVDAVWYEVDRDFSDGEPIPIGRPCRNKEILVLNEKLRPVADGEVGELCIRGLGLALGYYGDWEKSSTAFIQNPLNPWYPEMIYRTGDLGYRGEDGLLYFSTRRDGQIKHMGYRIELGEVETALSTLPEAGEAVCFFDRERDHIVCCYEGRLTPQEMATQLGRALPKYMWPNVWVRKDKLPHNASGKVDRVALKEEYFRGDGS